MKVRYLTGRRVPLAVVSSLHPAMEFANEQIWIVYQEMLGRAPVVTGGQEDAHSEGSLHYGKFPDPRVRALDYDDDNITEEEKVEIKIKVQARVGDQFFLDWEPTHFHVEYDVRF